MSTSQVLQLLYSLDTSSPDFLRCLYCLIRNDEEEQYLSTLQESELIRFVDFLDEILDVAPMGDDASRRCLHKLRTICSHHAIMPSSYTISDDLTQVGDDPVADGGVSEVWKGTYNGRKVCIKNLKVSEQVRQAVERAFYKEAIIWKRLKHPNVVAFIGVTRHRLQFVSEWMPNGTLTDYVNDNLGANRVGLLPDVAEGLAYLHANHIMHGDLKGPNILVDHSGHACLTDFGFASVIRGLSSVLVTEVQGYTARWAAPEVLENGDRCTREADVFAFGMVVVEVFTGKSPFSEVSAIIAIVKIIENEWPDRPQEPGLTDSVWNMTCACWSQDPATRPPMMNVVEVLRECYRLYAADLHLSSLSQQRRVKKAVGPRGFGYIPVPSGLSSAYQSINKIAEELRDRKDGPKGELYNQLLELCNRWDAVPALYELAGVVKQRPCAQRFSRTTEIWKGTHDGKVVALKVLRLSRVGEMMKRKDSRTSEDDTSIKVARQRFCATAVFMKQIEHDNIILFHGVSTTISDLSLVFPWYKNGNIEQYLEKNLGVNPSNLLLGAVNGLLFLHSIGVAHGALQLSHILIDDDDNARLSVGAHNITGLVDTQDDRGKSAKSSAMNKDVCEIALAIYEALTWVGPRWDLLRTSPSKFTISGYSPVRLPRVFDDLVWKVLVRCWGEDDRRPLIADVYRTLKSRPNVIHTPWRRHVDGELPRALRLHIHSVELLGGQTFQQRIHVKLEYGHKVHKTSPASSTRYVDVKTWSSPETWVIKPNEEFHPHAVSLEVFVRVGLRRRDKVIAEGSFHLIDSFNKHVVVVLFTKPSFEYFEEVRVKLLVEIM